MTPRLARLVQLLGELAESGREWPAAVADGTPTLAPLPAPASPRRRAPAARRRRPRPRILAGSRVVRQGDRVIPLTRIEFDLLLFLAEHPRRVFTRLQLLSNVWGYEHAVARTVDVHVRRLRAKLGAANPLVTTVYGVGYRLADEARVSGSDREPATGPTHAARPRVPTRSPRAGLTWPPEREPGAPP